MISLKIGWQEKKEEIRWETRRAHKIKSENTMLYKWNFDKVNDMID